MNRPPPPRELAEKLQKASQLWGIGGSARPLTQEHVRVIKQFFDSGEAADKCQPREADVDGSPTRAGPLAAFDVLLR